MNLLNQYSSDDGSHSSSDHEEVKEKPRFPSIALALEDIPESGAGDNMDDVEQLPKMKLSQKEITMQREVKQNMASGENEYRYTEPAKLEVKMYKKRLHAQDNSDDEEQHQSMPSKRVKVDQIDTVNKKPAPRGFVPQSLRNRQRGLSGKNAVTEDMGLHFSK